MAASDHLGPQFVPQDQIIHRAIGFEGQLNGPEDVYIRLRGKAAPDPRYSAPIEIEAHNYAEERRTGSDPIAGEHWTGSHEFAKGHSGFRINLTQGDTGVVLHATDPHAPMSMVQQRRTGVYVAPQHARHADFEQERPIEPGTKIHVHGVSFTTAKEHPHPNPEAAAKGYTQWHTEFTRHFPVDWTVQA